MFLQPVSFSPWPLSTSWPQALLLLLLSIFRDPETKAGGPGLLPHTQPTLPCNVPLSASLLGLGWDPGPAHQMKWGGGRVQGLPLQGMLWHHSMFMH